MNEQISLSELAQKVVATQNAKRDFLAQTNALTYMDTNRVMFSYGGAPIMLEPTRPALRQMGEHCGIPAKYFDRMAEQAPDLLAQNLNHWFNAKPTTQMVRTIDGTLRAFLSERYRPLDNADCVAAVHPILARHEAKVFSCAVTETKLYLKAMIPGKAIGLKAPGTEWGKGHNPIHVLRPGIVISNSETGHGSVSIQPGVHEHHCSNLMVMNEKAMRKLHVQKAPESQGDVSAYITDETRRKQDDAFWATVRDLTTAALDGRIFDEYVQQIQVTMGQVIPQPKATVEMFADKYGLTNDERDNVLNQLINSGEPTRYGLQAAVTRIANDVDSYDRSSELQRLGGSIIELPKTDWEQLAAAA